MTNWFKKFWNKLNSVLQYIMYEWLIEDNEDVWEDSEFEEGDEIIW